MKSSKGSDMKKNPFAKKAASAKKDTMKMAAKPPKKGMKGC